MSKKGQITLIIIVLLITLFTVLMFLFWKYKVVQQQIETYPNQDMTIVESSIKRCAEEVSRDTLLIIGRNGGAINPQNYLDYFSTKIQYLYDKKKQNVPTINQLEAEIEQNIDNNIASCFNLSSQGFDIVYNKGQTHAEIREDSVQITLDWPITITKLNSKKKLEKLSINIPVRLKKMLNKVSTIIDYMSSYHGNLELSTLSNNEFNITVRQYDYETLIFLIVDEELPNRYEFEFASRFDLEQQLNVNNHIPILTNLKDFTISVGESFSYKIEAYDFDNDKIKFFSLATLFEINKDTGIIEFTPDKKSRGFHTILIEVEDSHGNENEGIMHINVI